MFRISRYFSCAGIRLSEVVTPPQKCIPFSSIVRGPSLSENPDNPPLAYFGPLIPRIPEEDSPEYPEWAQRCDESVRRIAEEMQRRLQMQKQENADQGTPGAFQQ